MGGMIAERTREARFELSYGKIDRILHVMLFVVVGARSNRGGPFVRVVVVPRYRSMDGMGLRSTRNDVGGR